MSNDKQQHTQFGISATADFEENTWTFQMFDGFQVRAGEYYIVEKAVFEANDQRIASLTEQVEQRWVSVEERLPNQGDRVLILEHDGYVGMSQYAKKDFGSRKCVFHDEADEQPGTYNPTHWQPLPPIPSPITKEKGE